MTSDHTLILFPGALGDMLCFLPTLASLRNGGRTEITVAARDPLHQLLDPAHFRFVSLDDRRIASLFSTHFSPEDRYFHAFDHVFSWTGSADPHFHSNLRKATRPNTDLRVFNFQSFRSGHHAIDTFAAPLGLRVPHTVRPYRSTEANQWALKWAESTGISRGSLVIHPGSGSRRKNWHGMAAFAERWRRSNRVTVLLGPADSADGFSACDTVLREQTVDRVAAVLSYCQLYVGNDSGISHLASAAGCHGLALFADTDATIWSPSGGNMETLRAKPSCHSCGPQQFCIHRLSIEHVEQKLYLLRERAHLRRDDSQSRVD